ncbi:MAG: beta-Ala-His dipeptidase [Eubacteriales bacterium]|nr:beta-Ala-His dipeptidase [Eubacteriales bacterium]
MAREYVLTDRQPQLLYRYFEDISAIPRVSGNEEAAASYVKEIAGKHGLWCHEDELHNVLVRKPGSPGFENLPSVLLEGHLDIVGAKRPESDHDFAKDPIRLIAEGNILHADGTTLGADNGCAVAIMLKILTDKSLIHPPLECLFTVQEEVGLVGAKYFDASLIQSRRAIGLDAGAEGVFRKGTSTKYEMTACLPVRREPVSGKAYCLEVSGLRGGDQGAGIPREQICAIKMTARVLHHLNKELDVRLSSVHKTGKSIPSDCASHIVLVAGEERRMMEILEEQQRQIREEYAQSDPGICICARPEPDMPDMLLKEDSKRLVNALYLMPYGARNRSLSRLDEVSCSVITKKIYTDQEGICIFTVISAEERCQGEALDEEMKTFVQTFGFHIRDTNVNRGWEWERVSPIRDIMVKTYEELFHRMPKVNISHGGNDCVVLKEKIPDLDVITTAATYVDYHTPKEWLDMDSFERVLELVEGVLKNLTRQVSGAQ